MRVVLLALSAIVLADGLDHRAGGADAGAGVSFTKLVLTDKYYCDGLASGDINRDGKMDVVAGPFWYAGPDFKQAREFYPAVAHEPAKSPTNCMFEHVYDFNGDGRPDILAASKLGTFVFVSAAPPHPERRGQPAE